MAFDEYDTERIKLSRKVLFMVYEQNFGDPSLRRELDRIATIIGKIDQLMNLKGETNVRQESRSPRR